MSAQELPDGVRVRKQILVAARDCVLYRGMLMRYLPPDSLVDSELDGCLKILVPKNLRMQLIQQFHDPPLVGHLGSAKTYKRVRRGHYWPGMKKDVWRYCRGCALCQKAKPTNKPPAGLMRHTEPYGTWKMVSLDLIGPLSRTPQGHDNLLVAVDYFSKWFSLFPLRSAKIRTIAEHMFSLCCLFGFPQYVLSDNGPQFVSAVYEEMWRGVGTKPKYTTPYHPQTNMTERVNRNVVTHLRTFVEAHTDWDARLKELGFALNSAVHESTGLAPCEIMLGRPLEYPWKLDDAQVADLVLPNDEYLKDFFRNLTARLAKVYIFVKENQAKASAKQKRNFDRKRRKQTYEVGDMVLRNRHVLSDASKQFSAKLARLREGPYKVIKVLSDVVVQLADETTGRVFDPVNVCQLMPFVEPVLPGLPVVPPRKLARGRPKQLHKYNLRQRK